LATVHFPEGNGGLGLPPGKQTIVDEMVRADRVRFLDMAAPTPFQTAQIIGDGRRPYPIRTAQAVGRGRYSQLWSRSEVLRLINRRARTPATTVQGPEGAIGNMMAAGLNQDIANDVISLLGTAGLLHLRGYPMTGTSHTILRNCLAPSHTRHRIERGICLIIRATSRAVCGLRDPVCAVPQ
jgi:hypothetical protein